MLAAGAAAVALAAVPARAATREADALTALVRAELDAAFVYREATLPGAATVAGQDHEHAQALATHVEALALLPPRPRHDRAGLGAPALAVLDATGARALRQAAIAYERSLIEGCAQRLPVLEDPNTVRTVATVMAGHAQHLVLHELISRG